MEIVDVPIEKLKAEDYALRIGGEDAELDELAASIGRIGVLVPLVVVRDGDSYCVVAGHRRFAACRKVGLAVLPCILRCDKTSVAKEVSFAENMFRKDLTPIETAAGIKDTVDQKIMDVPGVAAAMRRSEHWVHAQLAMLSWPNDVLECIHSEKISVAAASNLSLITDETYRGFLIRNALENGATARITASWLQAWRSMEPPEAAAAAEPAAGPGRPLPALPQAPCICCNTVQRTDAMSMVMICSGCITTIRNIGQGS